MSDLPPDGSRVTAMTYESDEYDRPASKVAGVLATRSVSSLDYVQCWVSGVQVDPTSVRIAPVTHAEIPVPHVRQQTPWSCGPACLLAVCHYFRITMSEGGLRTLTGATPEQGTPPEEMVEALDKLGLHAEAVERMELPQLAAAVETGHPVIMCLQAWGSQQDFDADDAGHWVVCAGRDATGFLFQDPALDGDESTVLAPRELLDRWHDEATADGRIYTRFGIVVSS